MHRQRLTRQQLVDLGLEDGHDVGIRVLALGRQMHREVLHLVGEVVDLRRPAVAELPEVVHLVEELRVHALELRIRLPDLVLVARHRVQVRAELRKEVGEVLLRLDSGSDRLADLGRRVEVPFLVECLRELAAGELVERLERLRGRVGRLGEEIERIGAQRPVGHEVLKLILDPLPVEALRRGLGGLHEQDVQLGHHLAGGLQLRRGHRVRARLRLLGHLRRILRLRGLDAAKEVVHRHVVDVHVLHRHGLSPFNFSSCLHARRSKVTARPNQGQMTWMSSAAAGRSVSRRAMSGPQSSPESISSPSGPTME